MKLTQAASRLAQQGGSAGAAGLGRPSATSRTSSTMMTDVCVAKEVESARLHFPSFDPSPMLDAETREIYDRPIQSSLDPADALEEPPHVQVRGSRAELLGLLRRLDRSGRLALFEPHQVRMPYRAGVFTIMKDLEKDRLILDSRPANQLEPGLVTWTASMGSMPRSWSSTSLRVRWRSAQAKT